MCSDSLMIILGDFDLIPQIVSFASMDFWSFLDRSVSLIHTLVWFENGDPLAELGYNKGFIYISVWRVELFDGS